jgi:hypothetical protein
VNTVTLVVVVVVLPDLCVHGDDDGCAAADAPPRRTPNCDDDLTDDHNLLVSNEMFDIEAFRIVQNSPAVENLHYLSGWETFGN